MHKGKAFLAGASFAFLLPVGLAQATEDPAQSVPDKAVGEAAAEELGDIVVTATRQGASLQRTAVAITAVSAETLEARGITNLTGLTYAVPAAKVNYSLGAVQVNIRGVGSEIDLPYVPEPSATNFNDIYIPRLATNTTVLDVERVEVLPGPQGTLYGKGAIGGVLNVTSALPKKEFGLKLTGEAGNYSLVKLTGILNLPVSDDLAVRVAASSTSRGAYFSNGTDTDNAKTVRVSMLWDPGDDLSVFLWGQYYHNKLKPQPTSYLKPFVNSDPYDQPQFDPGVEAAGYSGPNGSDVSRSWAYFRGFLFGGRITYNLGSVEVQYIPSYIHYLDDDERYLQGLQTFSHAVIDQTTQELRFSGDISDKLSWLGSVYYYRTDYDLASTLYAPAFGQVAGNDLNHTSEGLASFVQLTYKATDALRLTLGGRYSRDRIAAGPGSLVHFFGGDLPFQTNAKWKHFDWKVGVEADIAPQSLLYANVQTAYSPGGYRASVLFAGQRLNGQTMLGYTAGIKNRFFDSRLLLNAEFYLYNYKNYTVSTLVSGAFDNFGIPKTRIYGAQIDAALLITDDTKLNVNTNFLSARIKELTLGGNDFKGNYLPNAPKASVSVGLQHDEKLSSGAMITLRADTHYESGYWKVYSNLFNYRQRNFAKVDLSATYAAPGENWDITAYVLNATRKATLAAGAYSGYPSPYENMGFIDPPRTFGVRVNVKID